MKSRKLTYITKAIYLVALSIPLPLTAQQTRYEVIDLGTLGGTFSAAGGINDRGDVEGFSTLAGDGAVRGFLWRNGVMTDVGTLGGASSFADWRPSDSGRVGGTAETSTPDPLGQDFCGFGANLICLPFVWRRGVMTALPTLGGNNGQANGANDRDQLVGLAENSTPDPTCEAPQVLQVRPVIWTKGEIEGLPTFPGDPDGAATAINDFGQAVGFSGNCSAPFQLHALLWQNGTMINLGSLGGLRTNGAFDVNNRGQVVGWSGLPGDTAAHAFLWQNGVMMDIGTLPGDTISIGIGINNKSQVVGSSCDADFNCRAVLWENGVITDLNTLIPADSPLFLIEAIGTINARGQIAGYAFDNISGEIHAFLLTPSPGDNSNENASAATLGATQARPSVVLTENVRTFVRERLNSNRPGVKVMKRLYHGEQKTGVAR